MSVLVRPLDISFPDRFGTLTGPFRHLDGNAWICERVPGGNEANTHLRSTLQLSKTALRYSLLFTRLSRCKETAVIVIGEMSSSFQPRTIPTRIPTGVSTRMISALT